MKKSDGKNSAAGKNFEIWRRLTLNIINILTKIFGPNVEISENFQYYTENFQNFLGRALSGAAECILRGA